MQLLVVHLRYHKVTNWRGMLLGNPIVQEPRSNTLRVVSLLTLEHSLGQHLQLKLLLFLRRESQSIHSCEVKFVHFSQNY